MRREAFKFWDLVRLILETLRYVGLNVAEYGRKWQLIVNPVLTVHTNAHSKKKCHSCNILSPAIATDDILEVVVVIRFPFIFSHILLNLLRCGWGLGSFLRWWPPSAMWAGPLSFYGHHRGCLNNPIFSNLGLCAACWAHFMWHHKFWPTSASPTLDLFFKILLFHVTFLIFFSNAFFSPSGWVVIALEEL